jgi:mitochondrial fission protein ELM1
MAEAPSEPPPAAARPRVWLLTSFRAGDNAQVLGLAEALGWPFEIRQLKFRKTEFITNRLLGSTLAGVIADGSSRLAPPWPDLVISAGRRNEPVARWIRDQARRSAEPREARLVHLGRPWADPRHFDLIVTTPQYRVPDRANVLTIGAPLHRITAERLVQARALWEPKLAHLPRPWIAVLVGGNSPPYVFDEAMARELAQQACNLARRSGASLLITTSPRTQPEAAAALRQAIEGPSYFQGWTPDPASNPYLGFLALADAFIVTGESMSMAAEACSTGRPVHLLDMGWGWSAMRPTGHPGIVASRGIGERLAPRRLQHWALAHLLPARVQRDVRIILRRLVEEGHATWLGDPVPPSRTPPPDDMKAVVARVRALMAPSASSGAAPKPS